MTTILILFATFLQQQTDAQLQRQQQQIQQVEQQLRNQGTQLDRMLDLIETQRRDEPQIPCSVEIRWANGGEPRFIPPGNAATVSLSLFSTIGRPVDRCLPAEVRVTANYMDYQDNLICSGVIENLASQHEPVANINLQIQPRNLREFSRWRNEPSRSNSGPQRLSCVNPEGLTEATTEELDRAVSVRVRATVLPPGGGVSTAEVQLKLR